MNMLQEQSHMRAALLFQGCTDKPTLLCLFSVWAPSSTLAHKNCKHYASIGSERKKAAEKIQKHHHWEATRESAWKGKGGCLQRDGQTITKITSRLYAVTRTHVHTPSLSFVLQDHNTDCHTLQSQLHVVSPWGFNLEMQFQDCAYIYKADFRHVLSVFA